MTMGANGVNRSDAAYEKIRQLIGGGTFAMGERLSVERLCRLAGVSRTPARIALARLEAEELVVRADGRGYRMPVYGREQVREIYGCRALLESEAVRLATQIGPSRQTLRRLAALVEEMDALVSAERRGQGPPDWRRRFLSLNHEFHDLVYDGCGNGHLRGLIARVSNLPLALRHFDNFSLEEIRASHESHKGVLAAMRRGEADRAAALMREHIWSARDRMVLARAKPGARSQRPGRRRKPVEPVRRRNEKPALEAEGPTPTAGGSAMDLTRRHHG